MYSVELVEQASRDAAINAAKNNVTNMHCVQKKVENFCTDFLKQEKQADVIVVDPPRAGMHPSVPGVIKRFNAKEIIYVSCSPSTLVRDLEEFVDMYRVTDVRPIDMFPHTHHIETVVRLEKKN